MLNTIIEVGTKMSEDKTNKRLEDLFSDLDVPDSQPRPSSQTTPKHASARLPTVTPVVDITGSRSSQRKAPAEHPAGQNADVTILPQPVGRQGTNKPGRRPAWLNWRLLFWLSLILLLAAVLLIAYGQAAFSAWVNHQNDPVDQPRIGLAVTATPWPTPTAPMTPAATLAVQLDTLVFPEATVMPTPAPGGRNLVLNPAPGAAGWVVSREETEFPADVSPNHFGDAFLYAGALEGKVYYTAIQFDLSQIPRGSKIYAASLRLTGLRADLLNEAKAGAWQLHLLTPALDHIWPAVDYRQIHSAAVWSSFEPALAQADLGPGQINEFQFTRAQLALLERRLVESNSDFGANVSFRLDGPQAGDNLFAWDNDETGSGLGAKPELFLSLGPAPERTPPPYYVLVTSTPTPENVMTAAANALQVTAAASREGTATPPPPSWATPMIVTSTPLPENQATAEVLSRLATAVALTTGEPPHIAVATSTPTYVIITSTPTAKTIETAAANAVKLTAEAARAGTATPLPPNWVTPLVVTATPTPENNATAEYWQAAALITGTPTPLPKNAVTATATPPYVIITSTPTPENIETAAANSVRLTAEAGLLGTATPLPANWVTPLVVTVSPTPANEATVAYWQAAVLTTGTPTPLPNNVQTATPTPVFDLIEPVLTPTPTPLPSPTPQSIPAALLGKVVFLSDREGATIEDPKAYVYDPETEQLGRLTGLWPYQVAELRDSWSADQRFRVFTKDAVRFDGATTPALYYWDTLYGTEAQLTRFGAGIAYSGVWSPTAEQIAFVSNDSGDDEIWIIDRNEDNLKQLTRSNEAFNAREIGKDTFIPELNKHPSWSPDGQQIVFHSNRTGTNQLWVMNRDGSDERLLMEWSPYHDWAPVWIKYTDPAPTLAENPE